MEKDMNEKMDNIKKFLEKELDGVPFLAVVSFTEHSEVSKGQVSQKTRTVRVGSPPPGELDFLTYKNLLMSLHHDINNYFASLFPPLTVSKDEGGKQYG